MNIGSDLLGAIGRLRKTETVVTERDGSRTLQDVREGKVKQSLPSSRVFKPSDFEATASASRWLPVPTAGSLGPATSSLIVFDFDCTLTSEHMFRTLRSAEGVKRLAEDPARFYSEVFGGPERLERLRTFLQALQATGATIAILSNGLYGEIDPALSNVGLRHHFWRVMGGEAQNEARVAGKAAMLARLCLQAAVADGRGFASVLFIDDDRENFPRCAPASVQGMPLTVEPARGATWRLAIEEGGGDAASPPACPAVTLVGWPTGACEGGGGLSTDDMERLARLVGSPLAAPTPIGKAAFAHVNDPTRAWEVVSARQRAVPLPTFRFTEPGAKAEGAVRFVCISDTHSHTISGPLPDGDVLLHAGDFSNTGRPEEVAAFAAWFSSQPHRRKVVIAGNHDLTLDEASYHQTHSRFGHPRRFDAAACRAMLEQAAGVEYLCDTSTVVDGVTIYGSPWQPEFGGWAFNLPRGEPCRERWRQIPAGTDVVITHGPVLGHGDLCSSGDRAGDLDLLDELQKRVRPRYHVAGHVHEGYGATTDGAITFVNASTCTLRYKPDNKPLVFDVVPQTVAVG
uniref:Calcineurin-like phosphoesterase domain-containing protein n=1 Tax=Prymnesium polylepis TaxID=72548 RepID=A0A7S4M1R4_9EUKA